MFCALYITYSHSHRVTSTFLLGRWCRQPMGSLVMVNTLKHHLAAADMFMTEWGGSRATQKPGNDSLGRPLVVCGCPRKEAH